MTLRVAGGWVRDKLLGRESNDIDIALDTVPGREFAERVNEYLASTGAPTSGVGVIQANPEQSKHLETATLRVHGTWLDLVHLRSETYAEGSRIPDAVTFGSPEQDARRRDLTFNALFYNLHTRCVEDHLGGAGLEDLRAGIARTPLPPMQTLLDDPLRALRAVRLATRLGFSLAPDLQEAASTPQVHAALRAKVSRERVGSEVDGMLHGPHPVGALRTLCRLGLALPVLDVPPSLASSLPVDWHWACLQTADTAVTLMAAMPPPGGACGTAAPAAQASPPSLWLSLEEDPRKWALLASFLAPLRQVQCTPAQGAKANKPHGVVSFIIRESLKLRTKDGDAVARILDACDAFSALGAADQEAPSRATLGRLLRQAKHQWRVAAAIGAANRAPGAVTLSPDGTPGEGQHQAAMQRLAACREAQAAVTTSAGDVIPGADKQQRAPLPASLLPVAASCDAMVARCEALGLDGCWEWKPLVSGGEAQKALGMARPGPALGVWLDALLTWELDNPGAGKAQALAWLAQARAKGEDAPAAQ